MKQDKTLRNKQTEDRTVGVEVIKIRTLVLSIYAWAVESSAHLSTCKTLCNHIINEGKTLYALVVLCPLRCTLVWTLYVSLLQVKPVENVFLCL